MSSSQGPTSKPPPSSGNPAPAPSQDDHWESPASPDDFQAYMAKYGSYVGGSDEGAAAPASAPAAAGPAAAPAAAPAGPSPYADMFNERLEGEEDHLAAENAAAEAARAQ